MKPEAQRIAIAEACGWVRRQWQDRKGRPCSGWRTPEGKELDGSPPDYLNSLDAMHDAEGKMMLGQWKTYEAHLKDTTKKAGCTSVIRAKASHRAEAFLRTLNLWIE